ncbi:AAA family ATPase [Yimella sp. NH-Cas1]|uniref:ATP-dependent nuclease n=1 Tax=Yimella sp. NH-Cas1 TaxID=2917726 RepID=UPI001EFAD7F3|nr:AAA family ATPase [Yimella sp. NH-Cas1]MCG8656428.1 AAA family ATPase [Yimella sp. NH-Cas1]
MYLERLTLTNFQCFGPEPHTIMFDQQLTALLGVNASGKTAACQALLRLFSVVAEQRQVRVEDFHVPENETTPAAIRTMRIDAVFAFPELVDPSAETAAVVPEFFAQMAAFDDQSLKLRIVLDATWTAEGPAQGTIEDTRRVVFTFDEDYGDNWAELRSSDRNRIQMVYVPATRDGARQVTSFLRGRLWRAGVWSDDFREETLTAAATLSEKFKDEAVVATVTDAITGRWQELHHLGTERNPIFEPVSRDVSVLVTNAEMLFEPSATGRTRSARELSDGQQSLLHIAMTAATLDLESGVAAGAHDDKFDIAATALPTLTLLAIEEPENNLSPYFLSRVVQQLIDVTRSGRAQAVISSHSASAVARIDPEKIRHFRIDAITRTTRVNPILLPADTTDAGKYLREAVHAHPELYFARFVVLGEGDSEQVVIPKLAAARDIHIDQSFVAFVPLGGRHTNHFWRLLNQLGIPHATLLDFDWGRFGGGEGRIRDTCTRLIENGIDPFDGSAGVEDFASTDDIDGLTNVQIKAWLDHLEKWDIYYSVRLDLDMALLQHYGDAYTGHLEAGKTGPQSTGDARDAVLGDTKDRPNINYWNSEGAMEDLRWYRYLFLNQSKPGTHLRALSFVAKEDLAKPPERIGRLIDRIGKAVSPT